MLSPFAALALVALSGCSTELVQTPPNPVHEPGSASPFSKEELHEVVHRYSDVARVSYESTAGRLDQLVEHLDGELSTPPGSEPLPNGDGLYYSKSTWRHTYEVHERSRVFALEGGPGLGRLDVSPIDPAYLDYVEADASAGLINDVRAFPVVSRETIEAANLANGPTSVTVGFHALEFLLWGEDPGPETHGMRPFDDFVPGGSPMAERRTAFAREVLSLLRDDVRAVAADWQFTSDSFASSLGDEPRAALPAILGGMIAVTEDLRDRLASMLEHSDDLAEPSRFSDTSSTDVYFTMVGLENAWLGRYEDAVASSAFGIDSLVAKVDADTDALVKARLALAMDALTLLPAPLDAAVLDREPGGGRERTSEAIEALDALVAALAQANDVLSASL